MDYQKIIVMGTGSLLNRCLKFIYDTGLGAKLACIEVEKQALSVLPSFCSNLGISYYEPGSKEELTALLTNEQDNTLIFSIHNSYIFSKAVLDKSNIKVINFHNSLLPAHPGRNSPSWAIYEMDAEAGITWHEVVRQVDKGNIIMQKSVMIGPDMTAMELTRACVNLGYEAFKEILKPIVNGEYQALAQAGTNNVKMHFSHETPNGGILDPEWPAEKISAFVRALDYGAYPIFEKPIVNIDGEAFIIEKYFLAAGAGTGPAEKDEICFENNNTSIRLKLSKKL